MSGGGGGFLDEVVVTFESGNGGDGAASFHREKHVPRGGPNGADGGKGGSIILQADRGKRTLYDFKLRESYKAESGSNAYLNKRGQDGKDIILHVPVGTIVTDYEDGEVLADLHTDGMTTVICAGGRGGKGNLHFTNSVRQAPSFAQNGAPSEIVVAKLELKLLADVGLIGLPNAGKSTFLSRTSAAKPKIGAYPFTTLSPNLGVVSVNDKTFVIADLPGLIEGASEGHGLGHRFLKHAERNKVLLHLVDLFPLDGTDPRENFDLIEKELGAYSPDLHRRPRIIALNKADSGSEEHIEEVKASFADVPFPLFVISAVSGRGIEPLTYALLEAVELESENEEERVLIPVLKPKEEGAWDVEVKNGEFHIVGKRIERLVTMTRLNNRDALHFLHRKLARIGVINKLRELGAEDGDTVRVADWEFTFADWL